ncbi:Cytochrome c [Tautonia plasticadhaerens]|uniref:Cytochrome c n=2 Tax=Tautonia plasticadhaerens TaxID=2527974 RepID=A0A518H895_9BACT|nr:Cytochrome c [Tautonia plasticadhaerens]
MGGDEPPDPEQLLPGLVAEFRPTDEGPGDVPTVLRRVDRDLVHDWGGGVPDPRLSSHSFSATWDGWVLIRNPGPHRFQLSTGGRARLLIDGRPVVTAGEGTDPSGTVELRPGLAKIRLESAHERGNARILLDWEGPDFATEHVPAHLLFHEASLRPPVDRFEQGRRLADRLGCASCHEVLGMPGHRAFGPTLDSSTDLRADWIRGWLVDPPAARPGTPMPGFGLDRAQAADLAAFLGSVSGPEARPDLEGQMALNVADPGRGRLLFRSAGCLACHTRGDADETRHVRTAPDLGGLGLKRSREAVSSYLGGSGRNDPGRHRPSLGLTPDAAAHLAAYLTEGEVPAPDAGSTLSNPGDPDRGRALAESIGCTSCHEIPGLRPPIGIGALSHTSDPAAGCLADEPPPRTPRFGLNNEERERLRAFVAEIPDRPVPIPASTLAEDHLRRRNCLGCHSRDGSGGEALGSRLALLLGEDRELNALKGTLTPPDLSSVGGKLRPEYLDLALTGEAPVARPWLSMRMPRYAFEPGEADAIASYFRNHDRVEGARPADHEPPSLGGEVGLTLLGREGFGCVSCHVVGGRIPPGGEAETLGPDLGLAHRRMTRPYYDRWLGDPQRIIPGTPMPQFLTPAPGIHGTVDEQLGAIWEALGDDRLAERTSMATRQFLVPPEDRDLVVRDMIVPDDTPSTHYPRGLVVGLRNGSSLLFDADRLAWIRWWDGGFLSRTKRGRLWEWHPEGRRLWVSTRSNPPVVFEDGAGAIVPPREDRGRFGSFAELRFEPDGVRLVYELEAPGDVPVEVSERLRPRPDGWERSVEVVGTPDDLLPVVLVGDGPLAKGTRPGLVRVEGATVRVEDVLGGGMIVRSVGGDGSDAALLVRGSRVEEGQWAVRIRVEITPDP